MIFESLISKKLSSKENNSRNIFQNIFKEKKENHLIMSNSKKKREFKLIKNFISKTKDNNFSNKKFKVQKNINSHLKKEKNIKNDDNQNILTENSLSINTFRNYFDYSSYTKRQLYESTRKKFLSNSNLNLNSIKTNHKKNFSLDKTNLTEKNRRKKNLTVNSPELIKTINQNKKKSSSSKKYYLTNSNYNNENNQNSSSNSKNTLSFSSSPFSYSSSDNKNINSISNIKKGKNEPLSIFYLSNPKINEIDEIKNYKSKSLNKKQTKKLINDDNNNYKKNEKNKLSDKTKTTSINSGSNNISDNISSFRMSKSSFKTSNLSLPNSSRNNTKIVNDNINLKNAIANIELNDSKKHKKNHINIVTVSNSEKKLLIPEYSVKKPLIQDSYLSFNKTYNLNYDTFITLPKLKFTLKRNSKNKFQKILDNIILTSNEIGKDLTKFNSRNNKRAKTFSKNFNAIDIENNRELKLMQETLIDSNFLTQNHFHHLRCETVKYDNRLIDALKNSNEPFVVDIIKSRSKIRNRTLEIKRKNLIKSSKYKFNDYRTINNILNEEKLEINKFKNSIEENFQIINFLNKNANFQAKKVFEYLNKNEYNTINVSEKIRKIREFKRKKNKTIT